jgi:hypothetical protein
MKISQVVSRRDIQEVPVPEKIGNSMTYVQEGKN